MAKRSRPKIILTNISLVVTCKVI